MEKVLDFESVKPLNTIIPSVSPEWTNRDLLNAVKMRWGIGRNNSIISPGLYKTGKPDSQSDVFVSANYRLSFDLLRKNLDTLNAWILVIDTKGINVWCAAGKGNFGTQNLVKSIRENSLNDLVDHKRLIVPQLAATGVAAYKVKEQTDFRIVFGPVRATDIKDFIKANYKATPEMRKIHFPLKERLKLIPVDLLYAKYKLLIALVLVVIISGIDQTGIRFSGMIQNSLFPVLNVLTGYLAGIVIAPLFLPVIPFRAFTLKGAFIGLVSLIVLNLNFEVTTPERIGLGLIGISIASFMTMNFTGSSTYTSLSGVKLEMKWSVPIQIVSTIIGITLFIISKLI